MEEAHVENSELVLNNEAEVASSDATINGSVHPSIIIQDFGQSVLSSTDPLTTTEFNNSNMEGVHEHPSITIEAAPLSQFYQPSKLSVHAYPVSRTSHSSSIALPLQTGKVNSNAFRKSASTTMSIDNYSGTAFKYCTISEMETTSPSYSDMRTPILQSQPTSSIQKTDLIKTPHFKIVHNDRNVHTNMKSAAHDIEKSARLKNITISSISIKNEGETTFAKSKYFVNSNNITIFNKNGSKDSIMHDNDNNNDMDVMPTAVKKKTGALFPMPGSVAKLAPNATLIDLKKIRKDKQHNTLLRIDEVTVMVDDTDTVKVRNSY